ncbi:hypothetical protein L195_g063678, partial [Trifolium pratense]
MLRILRMANSQPTGKDHIASLIKHKMAHIISRIFEERNFLDLGTH